MFGGAVIAHIPAGVTTTVGILARVLRLDRCQRRTAGGRGEVHPIETVGLQFDSTRQFESLTAVQAVLTALLVGRAENAGQRLDVVPVLVGEHREVDLPVVGEHIGLQLTDRHIDGLIGTTVEGGEVAG